MGREREERVIHQSYLWSYTRSKQTTLKYCFDKQKFRKETQKLVNIDEMMIMRRKRRKSFVHPFQVLV